MSIKIVNFCDEISDNKRMNTIEQFMEICDERIAEMGITRAELLRRAGQSQALFNMALKRNSHLRIENIIAISEVLGISVPILLGIEETIPSDIRIMVDMLMKIPERDRKMISLNIKNYYEMAMSEKKSRK